MASTTPIGQPESTNDAEFARFHDNAANIDAFLHGQGDTAYTPRNPSGATPAPAAVPTVKKIAATAADAGAAAGATAGATAATAVIAPAYSAINDQLAAFGLLGPTNQPVIHGVLRDLRLAGLSGIAVTPDGNTVLVNTVVGTTYKGWVVDRTDRGRPRIVGSVTYSTASYRPIALSNGFFAVAGTQKVAVVGVSTKTAPTVAETAAAGSSLGNTGGFNRLAVSPDGNTLFVAVAGSNRVSWVDITTKTAPSYTGSLQDSSNLGGAFDLVALSATRLAVACNRNDATGNSVAILNWNGTAVTYNTRLQDATALMQATLLDLQGAQLTVVTGSGRLTVLDISNPDAPVLKGTTGVVNPIQTIGDIVRAGTSIFGTRRPANLGGMYRVDVSDPNNPVVPSGSGTTDSIEWFGGASSSFLAKTPDGFMVAAPDLAQIFSLGPNPNITPTRLTLIGVGDSLTNYAGADTQAQGTRGIQTYANLLTAHRIAWFHNGGVATQTIPQIAVRNYTDGTLYRPAVAHVFAGANSVNVLTDSAETMWQQILGMVKQHLLNGSLVMLATVTPSTSTTQVAGAQTRLLALNDKIRAYANATPNVVLVDYYTEMAADYNAGTVKAGYTVDTQHFSPLGAYMLAKNCFVPALNTLLAGRQYALGRALSGASLGLTGTGGTLGTGATGTVADGWTVAATAGSVTVSKPTASTMQLDVPASSTVTASTTIAVAAGDSVVGELTVDAGTFTAVKRFNLSFTPTGGATAYDLNPTYAATGPNGGDDGGNNPIPSPGSGLTLQTYRVTVPAAATSGVLTLNLVTEANGAATVTLKTYRAPSALTG